MRLAAAVVTESRCVAGLSIRLDIPRRGTRANASPGSDRRGARAAQHRPTDRPR